MKPKITIISVVYNTVNSIEDTVESIIEQRQKRPDLKLDYVVIDGGSTDGTIEILMKYDTEISKWISEKDRGIYDAMNKGLQMVNDGYVLFLGAGDKIVSLIDSRLLLGTTINAFYGDVWIGDNLFTSHLDYNLKLGNSLHHQGLLVHRSMFPSSGFDSRYQSYADYDLNIKLLNNGVNFIKTNELIGFQMPGGLTSKIDALEMLEIMKNNFGLLHYCLIFFMYIFSELQLTLLRQQSTLVWKWRV